VFLAMKEFVNYLPFLPFLASIYFGFLSGLEREKHRNKGYFLADRFPGLKKCLRFMITNNQPETNEIMAKLILYSTQANLFFWMFVFSAVLTLFFGYIF
jgi:hypothetical protein